MLGRYGTILHAPCNYTSPATIHQGYQDYGTVFEISWISIRPFPLVLTGGCLNATYIPTNITAQPARNMQCDIEVISAGVPEDKMFEELGIVEAEGSWWKSDLEDLLPKMMEQGCLAGGDALILQSSDMYSVGEDSTIPVQRISATVIRWMTE